MRKLLRKGSAEIVSIVLGVVVIGALALSVGGSISKQTTASNNAGMTKNTQKFQQTYNTISSQVP